MTTTTMSPVGPSSKVRTLQSIIDAFHASVGSNCVLELGMAVDHTGLVPVAQVMRAKEFGTWKTGCYGKPAGLAPTAAVGDTILTITFPKAVPSFAKFLLAFCALVPVNLIKCARYYDLWQLRLYRLLDDTSTTKQRVWLTNWN
jgi:alpha-L-fucosidase